MYSILFRGRGEERTCFGSQDFPTKEEALTCFYGRVKEEWIAFVELIGSDCYYIRENLPSLLEAA